MSWRHHVSSNTTASGKQPKSIGPASTPTVEENAPLFRPEHLFPLLRTTASSADVTPSKRKWKTVGVTTEGSDGSFGAEERNEEGEMLFNQGMWRWGMALVLGSLFCFVLGFWSIAVGPFVDTERIFLLDALANDTHYKYLLVFLVPVTLYAVIINWWGLKIFRHA